MILEEMLKLILYTFEVTVCVLSVILLIWVLILSANIGGKERELNNEELDEIKVKEQHRLMDKIRLNYYSKLEKLTILISNISMMSLLCLGVLQVTNTNGNINVMESMLNFGVFYLISITMFFLYRNAIKKTKENLGILEDNI